MGWLKVEGAKAVEKRAKAYLRGITNEIKSHITEELAALRAEMRTGMTDITASVDRVTAAVRTELEQVRAEAQANLDAASAALADASEENAELTEALQAEVSRNESLVATVDTAAGKLDNLSAEFEANDPQAPPVDEGTGTDEGTTEEPNV